MFPFKETLILVILTRFVEFLGILATFYLMFKGYRLKYIIVVGGIVLASLLVSVAGFVFREYIALIAAADLVVTALVLLGVLIYVSKNPEKTRDFTPPANARCPVCNVLIINEDELCTMSVGGYTFYFDSCDHLVKLMKEVDFFLEHKKLPKGEVKDVFVKTKDTKRWKKIESVHIVEEGGVYRAYEKEGKGESLDIKGLLETFKNKLSGGKA